MSAPRFQYFINVELPGATIVKARKYASEADAGVAAEQMYEKYKEQRPNIVVYEMDTTNPGDTGNTIVKCILASDRNPLPPANAKK